MIAVMLYLMAAGACVAAAAGYGQYPDSPAVLFCLILPVYAYAAHGTRFRLGSVFTATMLCVGCAAAGAFAAMSWLEGSVAATVASGLVLAAGVWVARTEVPAGVRVMRIALRGGQSGM